MRETHAARRRADPRRSEPYPRRHLPVSSPRAATPRACGGSPTTSSPGTIRTLANAERPYHALLEGVDRAAGRAGRALAAGRLHPWRDEHRQHLDLGRDHRLRPVRLHGRIRPGARCSPRSTRWAATPTPTSRGSRCGTLTRLAECLLPLFSDEQEKAIEQAQFVARRVRGEIHARPIRPACARRSACSRARDGDEALVQDLLDAMAKNQADFTLTFRRLCDAARRSRRTTRGPAICSPIPPPMTNGRRAGGSAIGRGAAIRRRAAGGDAQRSIRPSSRATTASRP